MPPKTRWLLTALTIGLVVDQVSKAWTRTLDLRTGEVVLIPGWLSLVHAQNKGAAFSMLADSPYRLPFFAVFTVVTVVALFLVWRATEPEDRWTGLAIGLFLVGALGNAIDRTWQGYVTDMVKVAAGAHGPEWWRALHLELVGSPIYPIWNVADAAIVCAVPLYLFTTVFKRDAPPSAADEDPADATAADPLESNAP